MKVTELQLQIPERYELLTPEPVGRGAMGWVYKAWDRTLCRVVALKRLVSASDDQSVQLDISGALREARTLAQISHPAILQVFDVVESASEAWIVCEWLEGRSLEKVRQRLHPLSVIVMAREILSALGAVHSAGVIHRDIKPSNIFLCSTGRLVLIDFGVAYLPGGSSGVTVAGTPRYSDIGRLEGSAPTECSDLFSLGLILLESASGECVLPNLAPLPLYRFFKTSFDERVTQLSQGLYPPLIEVNQLLFSAIDARGIAKSRDEALRLQRDCMERLDFQFHALIKTSATGFIKDYVFEERSVSSEHEKSFLRDGLIQLADKSLTPRQRAQWMSFTKHQNHSFIPAASRPAKSRYRFLLRASTLLLLTGAAMAAIFVQTQKNHPSRVREKLKTTDSIQATPAQLNAAVPQQTPLSQEVNIPAMTPADANAVPANRSTAHSIPTSKNSTPAKIPPMKTFRREEIEAGTAKDGFVIISANAWADVFINARLVGRLPMAKSLSLKAGVHKLRLVNPLTEPLETTIRIEPEQTVKRHFTLTPKQDAPVDKH